MAVLTGWTLLSATKQLGLSLEIKRIKGCIPLSGKNLLIRIGPFFLCLRGCFALCE
jgi:hypothetical protein